MRNLPTNIGRYLEGVRFPIRKKELVGEHWRVRREVVEGFPKKAGGVETLRYARWANVPGGAFWDWDAR